MNAIKMKISKRSCIKSFITNNINNRNSDLLSWNIGFKASCKEFIVFNIIKILSLNK